MARASSFFALETRTWLREFPSLLRLRLTARGRLRSRLTCSPPLTGCGYFLAAALTRGSFPCGCALGGDRLASACKHTFGDVPRSRHDNGVPRQGEAARLPPQKKSPATENDRGAGSTE